MLLEMLMGRYPEYEEPEEELEELEPEEEPEEEYTTDRGNELRPSDYVSPFAITIVNKRKYLQMLEYAEDLEADNKRMARKLALCEGNYYLKDSKSWGDDLRSSELARAKAEAEAAKLQRIVDDQNDLIDRYRAKIKALEDQTAFTRDEATKQFVSKNGMSTEEKQKTAYWMKLAGRTPEEIAKKIDVKPQNVPAYVSSGKKLLKNVTLTIGSDDVGWTESVSATDLDINGNSRSQEGFHVVGQSETIFRNMVSVV